jgi:4-hydroxy-tetrahydrodipicolinate reductase
MDWIAPPRMTDAPEFDVAIDFSLPDAFDPVLELCRARRAALVSGTTGLSDTQRAALDRVAAGIPVLWAANFSLGIAVLTELVKRAAAALPDWDCDIVESHHIDKRDQPSGTALVLGEAASAAGGRSAHYVSLRAGDIAGEHMVQLTGRGERLELVHRATHRDLFARGALFAATRLIQRAPGRYGLADLLPLPG